MKTIRSRMLPILIAAAVIVSFFVHWEVATAGFLQGYNDGPVAPGNRN